MGAVLWNDAALGDGYHRFLALPKVDFVESQLKHLEFIQGVINRMGSNSFRLKGWTIVLVSALLVLVVREDKSELAFIGLFPVVVFWGLDAYYLCQERLYIALYNHVRRLDSGEIDFSMETRRFRGKRLTWHSALLSVTLTAFYTAVAIAVVVAVLLNETSEVAKHGT